MNFKDAYKSFNDEVKGNPKVLDAILNGKEKRQKVFYMRPAFAYAVAAMLVISVSVIGLNRFGTSPSKPLAPQKTYIAARDVSGGDRADDLNILPQTENTGSENKANKAQSNSGINYGGTKEKAVISPSKKAENSKSNKSVPLAEETAKPFADATTPDTNPEDLSLSKEEAVIPHNTDKADILPEETIDTVEPQVYCEDPGMPMTARITHDEPAFSGEEDISAQAYFEHIGVDVLEDAKLPEDMSFDQNYTATAQINEETGEIVSGNFTAWANSAVDSQRTLSLSVSKQETATEGADTTTEYSYDDVTGEPTGARSVSDDISVVVSSQKVTQTEIGDLIDSLKIE